MVEAVAETKELRWDHFARKSLGKLPSPVASNAWAQIGRFRKLEWKRIRLALLREEGWSIPDGVEPHWTEPGSAVFWHKAKRPANTVLYAGVQDGWEPTSPLPANNASQIALRLNKGFRLRPPGSRTVEPSRMSLVEAATEPVAPPESESVNTHKFRCDRHPGNSYAYRTWKAYIEHCRMMGEAPQAELPEDVAKAYAGAKYVCFMHGATFPKDRTAKQHIHEHHRLRGGRTNLTLEQMQVKKVGAADKKGDR